MRVIPQFTVDAAFRTEMNRKVKSFKQKVFLNLSVSNVTTSVRSAVFRP